MRTNQKHGWLRTGLEPIIITGVEARTNHHRVSLRRRVATAGLSLLVYYTKEKLFSRMHIDRLQELIRILSTEPVCVYLEYIIYTYMYIRILVYIGHRTVTS